MSARARLWLTLGTVLLSWGGCGSDGAGTSADGSVAGACTPGSSRACSCPSGTAGQEICQNSGTYAACYCGGRPLDAAPGDANQDLAADTSGADGSMPDAGPPAPDAGVGTEAGADASAGLDVAPEVAIDLREAAPADAAPGPAGGCVPSRMLATGMERLIDVFVLDTGYLIVRSDGMSLVGRDGAVKSSVTAARPITTAAYDGTNVVTADAAMLTVFNLALESQGTVLLTEACASSALMDDGIFVCGPMNDWDRVFYTYNVRTRQAIATASKKYTYKGIPMRRVPGTMDFVTVTTGLSPSDFHLYRVSPGGADVVFVNESPYHGDFPATEVYGFTGSPPSHLVNVDGLLLTLTGEGCDSSTNSFTSRCFVKDGNLGTLWTNERFVSLSNAAGSLYAVVAAGNNQSFFDPQCKDGCWLQKIDVAGRKVISRQKHLLDAKRFLMSRPDPACNMVAVAYELPGTGSSSSFEWTGYRVDLLDHGTP